MVELDWMGQPKKNLIKKNYSAKNSDAINFDYIPTLNPASLPDLDSVLPKFNPNNLSDLDSVLPKFTYTNLPDPDPLIFVPRNNPIPVPNDDIILPQSSSPTPMDNYQCLRKMQDDLASARYTLSVAAMRTNQEGTGLIETLNAIEEVKRLEGELYARTNPLKKKNK